MAATTYAVAFGLAVRSISRSMRHSRVALLVILAIGFVLQTIGLYQRGISNGGCPLGNKFEIVQFLVWSATALFLVVGPAFRLSLLGFFTSGLVALLAIVSLIVPGWDSLQRTSLFSDNPWIELHATIGMFSYGAFGLLALTSVMFILQNQSLKQKHFSVFSRLLPSIVELDQISFRLLIFGICLLTLSLGIGEVFRMREPESVTVIKSAVTALVWLIYLVILAVRRFRLLSSSQLACACIVAFGLALLTLGPVSRSGQSSDPAAVLEKAER
ncbi:MAG: cytochrome c biogenesis protein CcsA [Opitutaceae bacterium]